MSDVSKDLIKKYENLSGHKGEFETREGTDSNGADTIQVWNTVTNSLVAEVLKGSEQELLDDPQVVPNVARRNDVAEPVEYKDGHEVKPESEKKSEKTELTDEEKAEKARKTAEAKAKKDAAAKEAADKKAKEDAEKANQNGGQGNTGNPNGQGA